MSGLSPRPTSAERLTLHSVDRVKTRRGKVRITVTIDYEPWGDGGAWDAIHAVNSVHKMIYGAATRAERKRRAKYVESLGFTPEDLRPVPEDLRPVVRVGYDVVLLENTKTWLHCHVLDQCSTEVCCLHNRSDHHMRGWPQNWRSDRYQMERVCEHGVGHPDPDDYNLLTEIDDGVHGCDGCCCPV